MTNEEQETVIEGDMVADRLIIYRFLFLNFHFCLRSSLCPLCLCGSIPHTGDTRGHDSSTPSASRRF